MLFAPVTRPEELLDDPHLNAAGALVNIMLSPGIPVSADGAMPALRLQPPGVGQHTRDILTETGCEADQIAAWEAAGVIRAG
ncbi:MAG TPA: hypothetical protein PLD47_08575 [Aggregatilineales bacterium]|nr:hypothetical protein [Aggregatilineales bacterium]